MRKTEYVFTGRKKALTGCLPKEMQFAGYVGDTLDETTIIRELQKVAPVHFANAREYQRLLDIYLGKQDILDRPQGDRSVNNRIVVNFAQAFTRDITGYSYGSGIQYVSREARNIDAVQKLNKMIAAESKNAINKSMGDNQSIGGHGFIATVPDALEKNGTPFEFIDLDPRNTEVVYSTYNINVPVFAFTVYRGEQNGKTIYTWQVWTSTRRYSIVSEDSAVMFGAKVMEHQVDVSGSTVTLPYVPNLIGEIPIVEYRNNQFGLGDWECAVPLFNAINSVASDSINDVEQAVISYLALFGVDVDLNDPDTVSNMKKNRILVFNGVQGINQDAKFITSQIDGTSVMELRSYLEQALKFVVGIPDRDTGQAGSDTGVSAQIRTGSGDLEIVAQNKCLYTESAERRTLRIILKILEVSGKGLGITDSDIDIEIPRSKTDNLQSKVQAGATLYGMNVSKADIAKSMDLSTDLAGFIARWEQSEKEKILSAAASQTGTDQASEQVTEDG